MTLRVAIICPGRGTYSKAELGSITAPSPLGASAKRAQVLAAADRERSSRGRATVTDLDQAGVFSSLHLRGENAAALIFTGSAQDFVSLPSGIDIVAVCGNSMGFYTALFASGALSLEDAFGVADTCGSYQIHGVVGGQIVYPLVGEDWRSQDELRSHVEEALAAAQAAGHAAFVSIRLGGQVVLGADVSGIRFLMEHLRKTTLSERSYPLNLQGHSAFHTPLLASTSARALEDLSSVHFQRPEVPLVDGRGFIFSPWTTDARALYHYTFGHQMVKTYDFTASLRVVLRECAPDALVLLGPGSSLGGAIGQVLVSEGYQGLRSKADFQARQRTSQPILYSLGRPDQASLLLAHT
jgi:acyl transferase domain-containing protein